MPSAAAQDRFADTLGHGRGSDRPDEPAQDAQPPGWPFDEPFAQLDDGMVHLSCTRDLAGNQHVTLALFDDDSEVIGSLMTTSPQRLRRLSAQAAAMADLLDDAGR